MDEYLQAWGLNKQQRLAHPLSWPKFYGAHKVFIFRRFRAALGGKGRTRRYLKYPAYICQLPRGAAAGFTAAAFPPFYLYFPTAKQPCRSAALEVEASRPGPADTVRGAPRPSPRVEAAASPGDTAVPPPQGQPLIPTKRGRLPSLLKPGLHTSRSAPRHPRPAGHPPPALPAGGAASRGRGGRGGRAPSAGSRPRGTAGRGRALAARSPAEPPAPPGARLVPRLGCPPPARPQRLPCPRSPPAKVLPPPPCPIRSGYSPRSDARRR